MSPTVTELIEKYDHLRQDAARMASAFTALRRVVDAEDPTVAADVAVICEFYACAVLDQHQDVSGGAA